MAGYHGVARAAIVAHKEHARHGLLPLLSEAATRAARAALAASPPAPGRRPTLLVPVPTTARSRRARGADPLAEIAGRVAQRTGLRLVRPLRHLRAVADQAGLDSAARAANLATALVADPRLVAGADVLLVDDIVTTGATLTEAARALRGRRGRGAGRGHRRDCPACRERSGPARLSGAGTRSGEVDSSASPRPTGAANVPLWHPPGSVVASGTLRACAVSGPGKPMPAAGETAHVRRLLVVRSRCGLEVSPAPPVDTEVADPGEGR